MKTVRFMGQTCTLEWAQYAGSRNPCLQLWTSDGPMATASITPDVQLPDGLIAIKDFRANAGILAALVNAGIVEDTGKFVRAGYELANVCRILTHE